MLGRPIRRHITNVLYFMSQTMWSNPLTKKGQTHCCTDEVRQTPATILLKLTSEPSVDYRVHQFLYLHHCLHFLTLSGSTQYCLHYQLQKREKEHKNSFHYKTLIVTVNPEKQRTGTRTNLKHNMQTQPRPFTEPLHPE